MSGNSSLPHTALSAPLERVAQYRYTPVTPTVIGASVNPRYRNVVVVSAMLGVTEKLVHLGLLATTADARVVRHALDALAARHQREATTLLDGSPSLLARAREQLGVAFDALEVVLHAVNSVRMLSPADADQIVSYGERVAARGAFSAGNPGGRNPACGACI